MPCGSAFAPTLNRPAPAAHTPRHARAHRYRHAWLGGAAAARLAALHPAGAPRPPDRHLAAVSARPVGHPALRPAPGRSHPPDRAVRRRQPGDARRRLRGQRPVGPRHRPPRRAHRRPAARLRSAASPPRPGLPGRAAGDRPGRSCCSSTGWRRRWASRRCCWWRCIRWPSGSPGGRNSSWASPSASAPRSATRPAPTGWMPPGRCCTARRSCGTSASTRSTPTRTARTTPCSASAPARWCWASRPGRSWRPATPGCCCCWRWPAGSAGWTCGSIRRWCCRRRCWRGRSSRWTSTTRPTACACSAPIARSAWRSVWPSCCGVAVSPTYAPRPRAAGEAGDTSPAAGGRGREAQRRG